MGSKNAQKDGTSLWSSVDNTATATVDPKQVEVMRQHQADLESEIQRLQHQLKAKEQAQVRKATHDRTHPFFGAYIWRTCRT